MKISALVNDDEKRIAITPETTKSFTAAKFEILIPKGYGEKIGFSDTEYENAGAVICPHKTKIEADIYLCVKPNFKNLKLPAGSYLIGQLSPFHNEEHLNKLRKSGVHCCALEQIPRISRAQNVDILSSQANIAGYCAVIEALSQYNRVIPLMMTAAGTIRPARVLIVGAGVAGLQAIATAKRLGAIVSAFDVRKIAKEQVESLGATFIEVESGDECGETSGGYAKEMSEEYKKLQAQKLAEAAAKSDIIITTAQIPNKPAPRLITKEMVDSMPAGAVIVDMAAESGGNCELTVPNEIFRTDKVVIIGNLNLAAKVAYDASNLFAKNLLNFVKLMVKNDAIHTDDEIVKATISE